MSAREDWEEIRELIGSGDQAAAIDKLKRVLAQQKSDLYNEALVQAARSSDLRRRERGGRVTESSASVERNHINIALLELVGEASLRVRGSSSDSQSDAGSQGNSPTSQVRAVVSDVSPPNSPSVFISYAKEDEPRARMVFEALCNAGLRPWMDETNLKIGQEWDRVLRSKVAECDYFVVLQSRNLGNRNFSYVHKEIEIALEKQSRARAGIMFVLPVLVDDGQPLEGLSHLQSMRLQTERDMEELIRAIYEDFERRREPPTRDSAHA